MTNIDGESNLSGPTNLFGTTTTNGPTNINGKATITGDTNINGKATITGDAGINGNLATSGNAYFGGVTQFHSSVKDRGTFLPWTDGRNYIRGMTNIDGESNLSGPTNLFGTTTMHGPVKMNDGFVGTLRSPDRNIGLEIQNNGNICLVLYKKSDGGKAGDYWCAKSDVDLTNFKTTYKVE
jgi:hypothetical protein